MAKQPFLHASKLCDVLRSLRPENIRMTARRARRGAGGVVIIRSKTPLRISFAGGGTEVEPYVNDVLRGQALGPSDNHAYDDGAVEINDLGQTSVPGVFVCGDGSGWSQGIVHANNRPHLHRKRRYVDRGPSRCANND